MEYISKILRTGFEVLLFFEECIGLDEPTPNIRLLMVSCFLLGVVLAMCAGAFASKEKGTRKESPVPERECDALANASTERALPQSCSGAYMIISHGDIIVNNFGGKTVDCEEKPS